MSNFIFERSSGTKGSFPLRAWNGASFVSFIDLFTIKIEVSTTKQSKKKSIKQTKNNLFHARSGNEPLVGTVIFNKIHAFLEGSLKNSGRSRILFVSNQVCMKIKVSSTISKKYIYLIFLHNDVVFYLTKRNLLGDTEKFLNC